MPTSKFYLKPANKKSGLSPIMFLYQDRGIKFKHYTKVQTDLLNWTGSRIIGKTLEILDANSTLEDIERVMKEIERDALIGEIEGLKNGIHEVLGDNVQIDLVSVKSTDIKLIRENGQYPVLRGTLLHIDNSSGILYTTGYIPYFETFPSMAIPRPLEISVYEQESSLKKICEEILALTKLNFNNCNYYDGLPITVRFAQKVGEITQYMDAGVHPPIDTIFICRTAM